MADFELQRKNMVESQVRPSDVSDRRIIRAMMAVPREIFAADDSKALAYKDTDVPVGLRNAAPRALLAPRLLARLVQLLEINDGDRVLEIGTATGYGAAILAPMAGTVVALESDEGLAATARANLAALSITNATVVNGPHSSGWQAEAPYAAILISGSVPEVSPEILDQLQDGGRLAAVVAAAGVGHMMQWRRVGSTYASRRVSEAGAPQLPGFERVRGFVF